MARSSERFPVEVVYASSAGEQILIALCVVEGTTLREALALSGLVDDPDGCDAGVFGCRRPPAYRLRPHDRVEIYRALTADPKEVRRRRAAERR